MSRPATSAHASPPTAGLRRQISPAKMAVSRIISAAILTLIVSLFGSFNRSALGSFATGDVITYSQGSWGDTPSPTNAARLLLTNYFAVYGSTFGEVEIGIPGSGGFSAVFSTPSNVVTYLPATGAIGPLNGDHANPTTTSSGSFGGLVLALRLNIDFSDAGFTLGTLGIPFGDLQLQNFTFSEINLNGLSVRQFSAQVNNLLGGGSSLFYSISQLSPWTERLNLSFDTGTVSPFANDHLRVAAGIAGDYNANGIVDAADYVVWRKGLGTTYTQNQNTTSGATTSVKLPAAARAP